MTIAYDHQVAGVKPETPTVMGRLMQSWSMIVLMSVQTTLLVGYGHHFLSDRYRLGYEKFVVHLDPNAKGQEIDKYIEATLFLQISNSSAILILSVRTLGR